MELSQQGSCCCWCCLDNKDGFLYHTMWGKHRVTAGMESEKSKTKHGKTENEKWGDVFKWSQRWFPFSLSFQTGQESGCKRKRPVRENQTRPTCSSSDLWWWRCLGCWDSLTGPETSSLCYMKSPSKHKTHRNIKTFGDFGKNVDSSQVMQSEKHTKPHISFSYRWKPPPSASPEPHPVRLSSILDMLHLNVHYLPKRFWLIGCAYQMQICYFSLHNPKKVTPPLPCLP